MESLTQYSHTGFKYVCADGIKDIVLPRFLKSLRSTRKMVKDFKIAHDDYMFGVVRDDELVEKDEELKQAKLFLKSDWVEKNLPNEDKYDHTDWMKKVRKGINPKETQDVKQICDLPPLIELTDAEKFKDADGKCIDIEVRGTRDAGNCYFKLDDIADWAEMENLEITLIDKKSSYKIEKDYKYFDSSVLRNNENTTTDKKKEIFVTYRGLVKIASSSRTKNVEPFLDWATKTLFTAHLGTPKAKTKLASKLTGIEYDVLKNVLSKTKRKIPGIYLHDLGRVKDLKHKMKLGSYFDNRDDFHVYKYGRSIDLSKRMGQHVKFFTKFSGVKLVQFAVIDESNLVQAEQEIRQRFKKWNCCLEYHSKKELVCLSKKKLKETIGNYGVIQNRYVGTLRGLAETIKTQRKALQDKNKLICKIRSEMSETLKDKETIIEKQDTIIKQQSYIIDLQKIIIEKRCKN